MSIDTTSPATPETEEEVVDGELVPSYAVVPFTGEAITLADLSDEQLAKRLDQAREFEAVALKPYKRDLSDEALRRMDQRIEWTIHTPGLKLAGDSPDRTEFNVDQLKAALQQLVDAEELEQAAYEKAFRVKTTTEVSVSGVKALRKLGGKVKAAIDECEHPTSKPRSVRVTVEHN